MARLFPSLFVLGLLATIIHPVASNTEKVIFTVPEPVNIPPHGPSLHNLKLDLLTPDDTSIRTKLARMFPTEHGGSAAGAATWLLLDHLTPGQRYELRVCWAAIEPTAFTMDVYELDTVWATPELIQSLAEYADSRPTSKDDQDQVTKEQEDQKSSVLLLQVQAAADYFTDDTALMNNPPPVLVDLILDPYLYNVLPQSLIPVVGYIVLVGVLAWFGAKSVASKLQSIAITTESVTKKQE